MNIVDSSGWLEYFSGGKNANKFEELLSNIESLIVPSITIYEVFIYGMGSDTLSVWGRT